MEQKLKNQIKLILYQLFRLFSWKVKDGTTFLVEDYSAIIKCSKAALGHIFTIDILGLRVIWRHFCVPLNLMRGIVTKYKNKTHTRHFISPEMKTLLIKTIHRPLFFSTAQKKMSIYMLVTR